MKRIKDWIWDRLFLDFYLDNRWTLRFRFLNLLSRDALRTYLTLSRLELEKFESYKADKSFDAAIFYAKRAKFWVDEAWNSSRRKGSDNKC